MGYVSVLAFLLALSWELHSLGLLTQLHSHQHPSAAHKVKTFNPVKVVAFRNTLLQSNGYVEVELDIKLSIIMLILTPPHPQA